MVERLLEVMPPGMRGSLGVYESMVNQVYDESEWQALDILLSSILVNMISPGVQKSKDTAVLVRLRKCECYIKIMQIINTLGVWEVSYPCEEFADEIRWVSRCNDVDLLRDKVVALGEWGC